MTSEPELRNVTVHVCSLCLSGVGGECHVPGCMFWMDDAPGRSGLLARLNAGVQSKTEDQGK